MDGGAPGHLQFTRSKEAVALIPRDAHTTEHSSHTHAETKHSNRPVPLTPKCPGALMSQRWDLRSSPTCRISHSILVSSMALRPKGHSCLSSRLLFSRTICQDRGRGIREARGVAGLSQLAPSPYPDVGVLMHFSQVQHVVQGQHSRRGLGEVHRWVDVVLGR